jgi:hypothetical protein
LRWELIAPGSSGDALVIALLLEFEWLHAVRKRGRRRRRGRKLRME